MSKILSNNGRNSVILLENLRDKDKDIEVLKNGVTLYERKL